jgi:hypothetical protein
MTTPENVTLKCPFCEKETITAIYIPPILQSHTAHAAGKSKTVYYQTKEKYEIQSGCSNCGKSQKEVEKALKEGKEDVDKEKRILKRLKEQGIIKDEITTKF